MKRYIKTKEPQIIDAEERLSAIVYLLPGYFCHGKATYNGEEIDIVSFDIEHYLMVDNELKLAKNKKAYFKQSTFYSENLFPNGIAPDEYAEAFIAQMDYINQKVFDGTELQQTRYWVLTAADVEIVEI